MVRRVDAAVYVARTRPQWPANERPINPAAPFKQAVCGSGRGAARGGHCILKPSVRKLPAPLALSKRPVLRSPATITGHSAS